METFQKAYLLDTNIILDDFLNVEILSDKNSNLIIITETILQELDKYKSGGDIINYNAREFIRWLDNAKIIEKSSIDGYMIVSNNNTTILILQNTSDKEINDDKIIETLINNQELIENLFSIQKIIFVSNDTIFRTKALLLSDFDVEFLKKDTYKKFPTIFKEFYYDNCFVDKEFISINELKNFGFDIEDEISYIKVTEYSGKSFYLVREDRNIFKNVNLDSIKPVFNIKPKNLGQKIFLSLALNPKNTIIVVNAIAGTGKTLLALSASLQLQKQYGYSKITYIRKTIISGNNLDEVGFLPGSLNEKLYGYLLPLKDNIELIIKLKNKRKKKWSLEELKEAVKKFENDHNITYEYLGHLRGRTLEGIIILDEVQNYSIKDLITILSRIKEGSKVFILGSIKQIDNPYLNKYNNALSFMLNQVGTFEPIQIQGIKLEKVERGPIVDWIENLTI
ncbi:PhoH family protein [Caminibacter mediatlanticus]|uniref:PhoH-related protein n=1 Tax=Caminibacter mediatlanticus TB-2 TaxID=391592 RepID=A0AAI9F273_9BACT|nr:PhoH family protein [Caminibacter mediatlanticus]EDM23508.1 phoH-related protein [Caminibacter mediatlanticus TB-2]